MAMMLKLVIEWRQAVAVDSPAAVGGAKGVSKFDKTHYRFDFDVGQWELDALCGAVNEIFKAAGSSLRIGDNMGDLIPLGSNRS